MIVRRVSRPCDTHTVSVRVQWDEGDVRKAFVQIARDAHAAGLFVLNECEVRTIIAGSLFVGLKDYQSGTLVDWAMAVARRLKLIEQHHSLPGKVVFNEIKK